MSKKIMIAPHLSHRGLLIYRTRGHWRKTPMDQLRHDVVVCPTCGVMNEAIAEPFGAVAFHCTNCGHHTVMRPKWE